MADFSIGVDLGGTNLRASAVTVAGVVLEDFEIPTDADAGPEHVAERMIEGIVEVRAGHSGKDLIGIGVGAPALIHMDEGVIAKAPNLPGWENFPLKAILEKRLGLPVILENDANAAALGEVWLGAGRDVESLILLTLGTGIGGGIISGGRIVHGHDGMAGELGHITVDMDSPHVCGCGNHGCMEAEASGTAIRKMALAAAGDGRSPRLMEILEREGDLTPLLVARAAEEGCEAARAIYEHMGRALGVGVAGLINAFNAPLYLLAGGVLASWDLFAPVMLREIEKRSVTFRNTDTKVLKAELGSRAGIFGAAHLPIQAVSGRLKTKSAESST